MLEIRTRIATFVCFLVLLCSSSLSAQAPDSLSFQGVLTDTSGASVPDGNYDLLFKMYKGSSTVWQQTHSNTPVESGLFNVILSGSVSWPLDTVAFNKPIDLGLTVDGGTELTPRTPLTSAAYALALRGLSAVWAENGSGSQSYNLVGGYHQNSVGSDVVGATISGGGGKYKSSPFRPNEVTGDFGTVSGGFSNVAGTGEGATVGGGIGNYATGVRATVAGGTANQASGDYATIPGGFGNSATADYSFAAGQKAFSDHLGTFVWADSDPAGFYSTGRDQFLIQASGGVGIGTDSPAGELHVSGGTGDAQIVLEADTDNSGESDNPLVSMTQDGGTVGVNIGLDEVGFGSNNFGIGRRYTSVDHFDTFVIQTSDGDIGIGTNNPGSHRLQVVNNRNTGLSGSTIHAENSSTGNGIAGIFVSNGTDATLVVDNNGTGDLIKVFGTGLRFAVRNNGDVRADGTYASPATDLAEVFEVEGSASTYEPGDVLVISTETARFVEKCSVPSSTRVVGVYATKPGVLLGTSIEGRTVPMGVVGVLPTKVTTQNGPIRQGDLLTTSSTAGHAMRADPTLISGIEIYPTGSILGKALESFEGPGNGVIEVMVNTQ